MAPKVHVRGVCGNPERIEGDWMHNNYRLLHNTIHRETNTTEKWMVCLDPSIESSRNVKRFHGHPRARRLDMPDSDNHDWKTVLRPIELRKAFLKSAIEVLKRGKKEDRIALVLVGHGAENCGALAVGLTDPTNTNSFAPLWPSDLIPHIVKSKALVFMFIDCCFAGFWVEEAEKVLATTPWRGEFRIVVSCGPQEQSLSYPKDANGNHGGGHSCNHIVASGYWEHGILFSREPIIAAQEQFPRTNIDEILGAESRIGRDQLGTLGTKFSQLVHRASQNLQRISTVIPGPRQRVFLPPALSQNYQERNGIFYLGVPPGDTFPLVAYTTTAPNPIAEEACKEYEQKKAQIPFLINYYNTIPRLPPLDGCRPSEAHFEHLLSTALAHMDAGPLEMLHSLVERRLALYRKAQDFVDSYQLSLPEAARDLWPSEASFVTTYPEVFYRFVLPDDPHWTLVAGLVARAFYGSDKTPAIDDPQPIQHWAYRPPMKKKTNPWKAIQSLLRI